jgi:hypothetical protein
MEPEGSWTYLQVPAICPYPEPVKSSPCSPYPTSWRSIWLLSGSSKLSLSPRFPHQNPVFISPLPHACYMHHPSHSSPFDQPNNIDEQYRSFISSECSYLHSFVTSSLLGLNTYLSTLFSDTVSLRSSLNVSDHVICNIYMFKSIMDDKTFCTVLAGPTWI